MVKQKAADAVVDVAVIGGGVAGVYTGWRLRTTVPKSGGQLPSVALFELSDRIGGRLLSATPPLMPHVTCELGGMRYESIHRLVRPLVEEVLELPTEELPVAEPDNIAYLRGVHLRLKDLGNPEEVPYGLSWPELMDPGTLLTVYAANRILPGAVQKGANGQPEVNPKLAELVRKAEFGGKPLWQQGFWNVLLRVLSNEGYAFAMDAGGYDSLTCNWNAADALPFLLSDFKPDVKYKRLPQGYDQVPEKLAERLKAAGGTIERNARLSAFELTQLPDGSRGVAMHFDGRSKPRLARRIVLALPQRSIELVTLPPELDTQGFRKLLGSVRPIPLFKLFVCYDSPWWEPTGPTQGRSVTDLPLRQCYYWAVEGRQKPWGPKDHVNPDDLHSALLASYDDMQDSSFWGGLRDPAQLYELRIPTEALDESDTQKWNDHQAPAPMVHEIHRQLLELHGVDDAPLPYAAAYQDWQVDPFGGGVHFWNVHEQSWKVIPRIVHPVDDLPVYICGEAWSHQQGWVEGALQTTEVMLENHFDLARPTWEDPA